MKHDPVLIDKVIETLGIQPDDVVVDGTLGLGGHTTKFVEMIGDSGKVIGFDLDNANLQIAQKRLKKFEGKVTFINDSYHRIDHYTKVLKLPEYNKVLIDLGLSSPHLDDPLRGFSFKNSGPLDMRFNKSKGITAADILHKAKQEQLEDILRNFGEVANFRKIANKIVEERTIKRFTSTADFAERITPALPKRNLNKVLAQVFQALRIAVNDELNVLQEGLIKLWSGLAVGGRFAVISYHSLEDRIVKRFFMSKMRPKQEDIGPKTKSLHGDPLAMSLTKKVVVPSEQEIEMNPRSRSAKLRVYEKISN